VLLHAICDAILWPLKGDIGTHFPDTSNEFKDIDSKILLQRTRNIMRDEGYYVVNLDCTLCLQEPKIRPYVEQMQEVIASILEITVKQVSIKATTTEKMGFVGREEGLQAYATVLLKLV
jgi:2-C-methyl-D-erythritol 2,4-cyclodiphosphate synthase